MHELRGRTKPTKRSESERRRRSAESRSCKGSSPVDLTSADGEVERERIRWDPKHGELCLSRSKPEETLVENRSNSDVQIDHPTWALEQKTNRTVW